MLHNSNQDIGQHLNLNLSGIFEYVGRSLAIKPPSHKRVYLVPTKEHVIHRGFRI